MITSNKMPELAATDIVKLRNGKIGIVLGNEHSDNYLAIYTNITAHGVSCKAYLSNYKSNRHNDDHSLDIIKVWKSNYKTQYALINTFYTKNSTPKYRRSPVRAEDRFIWNFFRGCFIFIVCPLSRSF